MTEHQITINGIVTNYKIFGHSGKPMLILHGWPSSSEKWVTVAELLSQKDIIAVVPDLPGFGKSQEPPTAWKTDTYVEWVRGFCDAIPELSGQCYVLGHSFGGVLSAKFAIKYTQRIEKLFLVSAAAVRKKTARKKLLYSISMVVKIFKFLPYYESARKAFYKFIIRKSDYPYVSGIMKETYANVILDDLSHKLPFLKVPTVIIWGDKDDLTPKEDAELIHQKIRNSKLIFIPGAKHSIQLQFPELLVEKITENMGTESKHGELLSLAKII
jgi:pimeloyl-ACP methyl ester carboxylesterase